MAGNCGKVGLAANSWAAWDEETTYGTLVAVSGSSTFALFTAESMKGDLTVQSPPTISSAHSPVNLVYLGRQIVSGDVTWPVVYEGMEAILLHAFGSVSVAGGTSGTFQKTFNLASAGRYANSNSPSLSLHLSRGIVGSGSTNPTVFSYAGCVVDAVQFSCSRDGPLLMRISFYGREESAATSSATVTLPTAPVANGTECMVTWGGVEIPVYDWTISMRRNIDRDRFPQGSTLSCEPPMGKYEVSAQITTEWDNEVRAGSTTLRADYAARTARALAFNFTSTDAITGTAQNYTFNLSMEKGVISAFAPNITGPGRVLVPMTITGYDDTTTSTVKELKLVTIGDNTYAE